MGTVDICSTCHSGLHISANKRYRGVFSQDAFTPDILPRAEPFIEIILQARMLHEAGAAPNELKNLMIKIPAIKLAKLHELKAVKGFKSMEKFLLAVIDNLLIGR